MAEPRICDKKKETLKFIREMGNPVEEKKRDKSVKGKRKFWQGSQGISYVTFTLGTLGL
jgi:hypothetical protein